MKTLGMWAAACSAIVVMLASTATAGPLAGSVLQGLAADLGLIEPVHGCHRGVQADRFGWHYHRRNCNRVNAPPPDYGPYGPYGPYEPYRPGPCYWVGPVRVCP